MTSRSIITPYAIDYIKDIEGIQPTYEEIKFPTKKKLCGSCGRKAKVGCVITFLIFALVAIVIGLIVWQVFKRRQGSTVGPAEMTTGIFTYVSILEIQFVMSDYTFSM